MSTRVRAGARAARHQARLLAIVALAAVALVATACGSSGSHSTGAADEGTIPSDIGPPPTPVSPVGTEATLPQGTVAVSTLSSKLGDILVDGLTGRALYAYKGDGHDQPTCVGACATQWVPLTGSSIGIAPGLTYAPGEFKLVVRPGGGPKQLSVDGHPIYEYRGDQLAAEAKGQGLGGQWYVLGPNGNLVTKKS
jgi:predicted lipoprotein with Yx(FWY)xxD motif